MFIKPTQEQLKFLGTGSFSKSFEVAKANKEDIYLFEGIATVTGEVDKVGERFEHGAFDSEIGKTVVIQVMHSGISTIIGTGTISKQGNQILVKGKLYEEVENAKAIAKAKADGVQFNLSIGGKRQEYTWIREVSFTGEDQQAHYSAVVTKTEQEEAQMPEGLQEFLKAVGVITEKLDAASASFEKATTAKEAGEVEKVKTELSDIKKSITDAMAKIPTDDATYAKSADLDSIKTMVEKLDAAMAAIGTPKAGDGAGVEKSLPEAMAEIEKFVRDAHHEYRKAGEALEAYSAEYKKTLTTDAGSTGYLIPKVLEREIIKELKDSNTFYAEAKVYEASSKSLSVPIKLDRTNSVEGVTEGSGTAADGNLTYGILELECGILQSQIPITDECREDTAFNMAGEIQESVTEDFDTYIGDKIVNGVVSTTQKFEGFTKNATVIANAITSASVGEITHADLVELEMALKPKNRVRGKYFASTSAVKFMKQQLDGNGKPLWYQSVDKASYPTYNGYPVIETEFMDGVAAGKYPVLFADFKEFYAILRRKGITTELERDAKKRIDTVITNARLGGKVRRATMGRLLKIKA